MLSIKPYEVLFVERKLILMSFTRCWDISVQIDLEKTAKIHDLKLNGEFKTCEQWDIAKAREKNVNKD
jgi:hypothetical protein